MPPNVILIHGKDTDPSKKWYPWLSHEMTKRDIIFQSPHIPEDGNGPLESWLEAIEGTRPDAESILIGHSRGGVAILRWLERSDANMKVKRIILIATNSGFLSDKSDGAGGLYTTDGFDFEKIRTHCESFIVFHSRDDQWVDFSAGEENARGLDAQFLIFEGRGHFGSTLLKPEIPELLDFIDARI